MAIYAQCPFCKRKQSVKNKKCSNKDCELNLDAAKGKRQVVYFVDYSLNGKRKRKLVGKSIKKATRANADPVKYFEDVLGSDITFKDLTKWYLDLESVKALASYGIIEMKLKNFNKYYGDKIVTDIKQADLEDYTLKRQKKGLKPGTVDQDMGKVKSMIYKAYDNDILEDRTVKAFRRIKKTLKKGTDVRDRILNPEEFSKLMEHSSGHVRDIIATGYYTGMRRGEILSLTWDKVDLPSRFIYLEPSDTKDKEKRDIPICEELYNIFVTIPGRIKKGGQDNHVFKFRGKPLKTIRNGLRRSCEKAGIVYGRFERDGFIFHDLRHTFNTNARKAGISDSVIMKITGHSTREMFDRYNSIDKKDLENAVKKMGVFLQKCDQSVTKGKKEALSENAKGSINP